MPDNCKQQQTKLRLRIILIQLNKNKRYIKENSAQIILLLAVFYKFVPKAEMCEKYWKIKTFPKNAKNK
jgi:hypothetical protein